MVEYVLMAKVIYDYPPNYQTIKEFFNVGDGAVFAYGDTIYSPFYKGEIPADLELHENVHFKQQREFATPDLWWTKYCLDTLFREDCEIEAYAYQYNFVKKNFPAYASKEALNEFASNLSSDMYKLGISKSQAETAIRQRAKMIV